MKRLKIVCGLFCIWFLLNLSSRAIDAQNTTIEPGSIAIDSSGVEMVYIPAVTFTVGIDKDRLLEVCKREANLKRCVEIIEEDTGATYTYSVDLPGFWMDRYEVTNQQFEALCRASFYTFAYPCDDPLDEKHPELNENPQQPRVGISWARAVIFCSSRLARLPTEAEWEYAASGPEKLIFPWGNTFNSDDLHPSDAIYPLQKTYPVGTVPQNRSWIGIYDMAGNAAEWVEDGFLPRFLMISTIDELHGENTGQGADRYRVLRGGSWEGRFWPLTNFYREAASPGAIDKYTGFRCAGYIHPGK